MITKDTVIKKEVAEFKVAPDCPLCVEEFLGILAAKEIYDNYVVYPFCERHTKEIESMTIESN